MIRGGTGFVPIEEPVCITVRRIAAWRQARAVAPHLPEPLLGLVMRVTLNDRAGSDALLLLADALVCGAKAEELAGNEDIAHEMRALADLPRLMAPRRADRGPVK